MGRRLAVGVSSALLAVAASACGGGSTHSPAAGDRSSTLTASQPASRTAASTPSTWSVSEAGQQYVAMTARRDADLAVFGQLINQRSNDPTAWHAACGNIADTTDQLEGDLISGRWAPHTADLVGKLLTALDGERDSWQLCQAFSLGGIIKMLSNSASGGPGPRFTLAISQSNAVRASLGLPTS